MSALRRLIARIIALFDSRRRDADLADELAAHLEEAAAEHRRRGLSATDAKLAAMRDFGGLVQTKEAYRDVRGFPALDAAAQDVRYAARVLRKSPGFFAAAVATITLGIGATTAIFTVTNAVMLRDLPVRDPARLVVLGDPARVHSWSTGTPRTDIFSFPLYREIRDRTRVFSSVLASSRLDNASIAVDGGPEDVKGRLVTGDYFETLGVQPFLGRLFTGAEDRTPGADPYAVISYAYWQRRFAGDPSVIGRTVRLKGYPFTIVGVAPPEFFGEVVGDRPDVWAPMMMEPQLMPGRAFLDDPNTSALDVIGRLKPGTTLEQARADVASVIRQALTETLASRLSADDRDAVRRGDINVAAAIEPARRGLSQLRQQFSTPLLLLMGIVGLVMLVACVNVANLMLARSSVRRREIAVRAALGAAPGRIVRQLLTESILLALIGGAAGLLVARWGADALVRLANRSTTASPLVLTLDSHVLAFTAAVCLATGVLFGLVPALEFLRADLTPSLKEADRGSSAGAGTSRIGRTLVTAQIAFGLTIAMSAGLLVESLRNLQNVDLGYRRERLLVARVDLLGGGYTGAQANTMIRTLVDRLSALPGVGRATASSNGLFSGSESADLIRVEGFTSTNRRDLVSNDDEVGPDYFSTIGVPIVRGRDMSLQDFASAARVAIVNETFARFYFGEREALGHRIFIEDSEHPDAAGYEIVGIARDVRDHAVRTAVPRRFYTPLTSGAFDSPGAVNFEVRTDARPDALVEPVRRAIAAAGSGLIVDSVSTADALVGSTLTSQVLVAQLSMSFGALVLVLIGVGLYGSTSYGVASRTKEIGVRMALGASRGAIVWMVARDAGAMVAIGIAAGVPLALLGTRLFRTMLFEVAPADPAAAALAVAVVAITSVAAAIVPARRATRIDPTRALRQD